VEGDGRDRAVLLIHGGTSGLDRGEIDAEEERARRASLEAALRAGKAVLDRGGSALDAVEASVRTMEDDPRYNAGRGAVFNADAEHQLDASIMDGRGERAGAVAAVENVKNPISAARLVMERSPHVLLSGEGADDFAAAGGLETVTQDYYFTENRWEALLEAKREAAEEGGTTGTVGAVALDRDGNLAAATSTGGRTNKLVGRVGDSPIPGAGTYANNETVAVSGTGVGEYYIRGSAAFHVHALMAYRGFNVRRAARTVLDDVVRIGGESSNGIIALDRRGRIATEFTRGMNRAYVTRDGRLVTEIYPDE
jgi:beta-aspartyl-peptidase (threonine type)